jgi:hypothetical protein
LRRFDVPALRRSIANKLASSSWEAGGYYELLLLLIWRRRDDGWLLGCASVSLQRRDFRRRRDDGWLLAAPQLVCDFALFGAVGTTAGY